MKKKKKNLAMADWKSYDMIKINHPSGAHGNQDIITTEAKIGSFRTQDRKWSMRESCDLMITWHNKGFVA